MTPALVVARLVAAGLAVRTIERKCGFPRSKLARLVEGSGALTAEERATLEEFARGILIKVPVTKPPFHERVSPRYGR